MAKVYSAPEQAPDISIAIGRGRDGWKDYEQAETAYVERMQAFARERTPNDSLAGKVLRVQYADGHAQYVVLSSKPLALIHLAVGDAWDLPDYQTRGLRLADVKRMVEWDEKWRVSA